MHKPRGWLLLAVVAAALMVMAGEANRLALWSMTAAGAFFASLPGRIRHRKEPRLRSSWQGCLTCFAAGFIMVLAGGLGRMNGRLLTCLMEGSVGAWVFGALSWLVALAVSRIKERRRHA